MWKNEFCAAKSAGVCVVMAARKQIWDEFDSEAKRDVLCFNLRKTLSCAIMPANINVMIRFLHPRDQGRAMYD